MGHPSQRLAPRGRRRRPLDVDLRLDVALERLGDQSSGYTAETRERAAPISLLVRQAVAADPDAADIWEQMNAEQLTGMTHLAG